MPCCSVQNCKNRDSNMVHNIIKRFIFWLYFDFSCTLKKLFKRRVSINQSYIHYNAAISILISRRLFLLAVSQTWWIVGPSVRLVVRKNTPCILTSCHYMSSRRATTNERWMRSGFCVVFWTVAVKKYIDPTKISMLINI